METLGLFAIALMLIYIFLTDANHIMPQIKNPESYPNAKPSEHVREAGEDKAITPEASERGGAVEEGKKQSETFAKPQA